MTSNVVSKVPTTTTAKLSCALIGCLIFGRTSRLQTPDACVVRGEVKIGTRSNYCGDSGNERDFEFVVCGIPTGSSAGLAMAASPSRAFTNGLGD